MQEIILPRFRQDIKSFSLNVWVDGGSISPSYRYTTCGQNGDKKSIRCLTAKKNKQTGRAEGWCPGLGIRFGERSLRYFSGQGRIQTMWLKEASWSIITVLINHRAKVVGEIDACVVIKAQTSQQ